MTSVVQAIRSFSTSRWKGSKINIQKPRVPWTERRILNAVTVPLFPSDLRSPTQKCHEDEIAFANKRKSELQDAYEAFRTRHTLKMFTDHKMVAICHILPMMQRDLFNVKVKIHQAGLQFKYANNRWAKNAIHGTHLQNLEPYLTSKNVYLISDELRLQDLVAVLRKTPELQLLGGLIEKRILSRDAIQEAAKLPPLDVTRGELLTILSASSTKTTHLLDKHQSDLSASLSQLIKQQDNGDIETSETSQS